MRYDILIPFVLIAGIAAFSVSRLSKRAPMASSATPKRRVIEILLRAKRKLDVLREERRRIVAEHARRVDVIRAEKVKRDIGAL